MNFRQFVLVMQRRITCPIKRNFQTQTHVGLASFAMHAKSSRRSMSSLAAHFHHKAFDESLETTLIAPDSRKHSVAFNDDT